MTARVERVGVSRGRRTECRSASATGRHLRLGLHPPAQVPDKSTHSTAYDDEEEEHCERFHQRG